MSLYLGDKKVCPIVYTGSGSGSTISAINKTGSNITTGDKVWINDRVQTAGESFKMEGGDWGAINDYGAFIDTTGTFGWIFNRAFSVGDTEVTRIGSTTGLKADKHYFKYGPEGSIFIYDGRCDNKIQYKFSDNTLTYIGKNYVATYTNSVLDIATINIDTGEVINRYNTNFSISTHQPISTIVVEKNGVDYIYSLGNINGEELVYFFIQDGTLKYNYHTLSNPDSAHRYYYPLAVTPDGKYIIAQRSNDLRFIDISTETARILTQEEMPADLQVFYSQATCTAVFNPNNNILSVASTNTSGDYKSYYKVLKYNENTGFNPISIDLPIDYSINTLLTFSNDLSKACTGSNGSTYATIYNLTTTSGYTAVPYKFYNINENTVTGIAADSATADETFTVNVAGE